MNRSFQEQAKELEHQIENSFEGYKKWMQLWAKEECPYQVDDMMDLACISEVHKDYNLKIDFITAKKVTEDCYEWSLRGYLVEKNNKTFNKDYLGTKRWFRIPIKEDENEV